MAPRRAGAELPNGWRITPAGKTIASTGDMVTNLIASTDGRVVVAVNSGYQPNVTVFDARQRSRYSISRCRPQAWPGLVIRNVFEDLC